jgi:AraC-like DNA-binding protein
MWRITPQGPLSEFVDCFWIHEGYGGGSHGRERVLPTATTDLVFASHSTKGHACTVTGPRSGCVELDTSLPFSAIGVHFKPGGGLPFFGAPTDELHNQVVSLDLLWGRDAGRLEEQLWDAPAPEQRGRLLEEALRARMSTRLPRSPAVAYAVGVIQHSRGGRPVADITQRIGMSTRRFLDLFRREVGLSPKAFCRMSRFAAVLAAVDRAADVDWCDVALSCGYFDQAHFNHDFRAFAGVTPSEYLRSRTSRTHLVVSE